MYSYISTSLNLLRLSVWLFFTVLIFCCMQSLTFCHHLFFLYGFTLDLYCIFNIRSYQTYLCSNLLTNSSMVLSLHYCSNMLWTFFTYQLIVYSLILIVHILIKTIRLNITLVKRITHYVYGFITCHYIYYYILFYLCNLWHYLSLRHFSMLFYFICICITTVSHTLLI
jgi:hypothetical protein